MSNISFSAICTTNYFTYAKVLLESLRKSGHHDNFYLLIIDYTDEYSSIIDKEGIKIVKLQDLKIPKVENLINKYSAFELCNVLKPYFLEWLLNFDPNIDILIYFDTDIYVYNNLHEIINYIENSKNRSVYLLPNITCKSEYMFKDSGYKNELTYMKAGLYCGGFYALRNDSNTRNFLKWHQNVLFNNGYNARNNYMFVDQKILDFAPLLFNFIDIYDNETYNFAHWNYFDSSLTLKNGKYFINNKPLVFMHFSILIIDEKYSENNSLCEIKLKDEPILREICLNYWDTLKKNKLDEIKAIPYGYKDNYNKPDLSVIDPTENEKLKLSITEKIIFELKGKLSEKETNINELKEINRKFKQELSSIHNSKGWKTILKVRSLKKKIVGN